MYSFKLIFGKKSYFPVSFLLQNTLVSMFLNLRQIILLSDG